MFASGEYQMLESTEIISSLPVPQSILETFRCIQCRDYLLVPPIVLLSNGCSLCGVCSDKVDVTTYRQLAFEDLLKFVSFPCKFKKFGCNTSVRFGKSQNHYAMCIHRTVKCPLSYSCNWEGNMKEMFCHVSNNHSDLVSNTIAFKLKISEKDEEGLLVVHMNGIQGIFKYDYNVATNNLQYDFQYFNIDIDEVLIKIVLINDLDTDYKIHLKNNVSSIFNDSLYSEFCKMQMSKTLALNSFLPILNNPNCIAVEMHLFIVKQGGFNESEKERCFDESEQSELINYDLINNLICFNCLGYLLPPLYRIPNCTNAICWYCHPKFANTQPESDQVLINNVTQANFPCRWRDCHVIKQGIDLIKHELMCSSRMFNCRNCSDNTITRSNIASHVAQHGYLHFKHCLTFPVVLRKKSVEIKCFTIKHENILYIAYMTGTTDCHFKLYSEYNSNDVFITVQFEHNHCKIKSKLFILKPTATHNITYNDLPACFKNNKEVTVIIKA